MPHALYDQDQFKPRQPSLLYDHSVLGCVPAQAFTGLQKTAATVLQTLFASDADSGLHATEQQVRSWLGQRASRASGSSSGSSSSSSVLHASSYKSSSAPTQHLLGGCEAHVDRGLLTLVADTQPGLEVSHIWASVVQSPAT
jgi:hypothetical protein